ncbi:endonuclease/exonuclease/phosphatase family protein [Renibacterium salmoninarum]|nr:endonuclease/exonuclease/phosphatase family protein [Renibacterium salmoninarum]
MDTVTLPRLYLDEDNHPRPSQTSQRRRSIRPVSAVLTIITSLPLAAFLFWHRQLPDAGGLTMALESFLPWLGLLSLPLLISAVRSRSGLAWLAWLTPVVIWCVLFIPAMLPRTQAAPATGQSFTLSVATQNVQASTVPMASGSALMAQSADLVALQELSPGKIPQNAEQIYPCQDAGGTVALLSKYPVLESSRLELGGVAWSRALHATVQTPGGELSIYVVHAASVRLGEHADRDVMLSNLDRIISQDKSSRIMVLGDFNAASTDRALAGFQDKFIESLPDSGGLGFTWPSSFPVTRPDHIFSKGLETKSSKVLEQAGSDHRGLQSTLTW